MLNIIARILVLVAGLLFTQIVAACTCARTPLPELFGDSDDVYVAEVVSVRRLTQEPVHNQPAAYEVEVRPLMTLKGRAPESMKLTYTATYHDKSLPLGAAPVRSDMLPMMACETSHNVGTTILFLLKRQVPLTSLGSCSQRAVDNPKPDDIKAIRELLP